MPSFCPLKDIFRVRVNRSSHRQRTSCSEAAALTVAIPVIISTSKEVCAELSLKICRDTRRNNGLASTVKITIGGMIASTNRVRCKL